MLKSSKIKTTFLFALVLIMCLSCVTTAFAQQLPNAEGAIVAQDEDNPVQATITKNLRMPFGTTTPVSTFNFLATPRSVDEKVSEADLATMPALNPAALTVSFAATDTDPSNPTAGLLNVPKETGNLFHNVNFPHAGIFVYDISEIHDTNPNIDQSANDLLYYSDAQYTLTVYVANKSDGSGTFVYAVGAHIITNDAGNAATGKVDPTPGGDGEHFLFSRMAFANDFVRTQGPEIPGTPDPVAKSTLTVSKAVSGDFADRTQFFNFSMTLTVPELIHAADVPPYYRAYVVENNTVIDPVNNAASALIGTDAGGSYIKISTTGSTEFTLRDGQRLAFVDTPVGTRYTATETAATNYQTAVTVITGSGMGVTLDALTTGEREIGEGTNSASFVNTRDSVTPTGLNLNNLPFIGLILLAAITLITFVVVKIRRRNCY